MQRWGVVGKQRIVDEGPLAPYPDTSNVLNMHDVTPKAKYNMTTFGEVPVMVDVAVRFRLNASTRARVTCCDLRQRTLRISILESEMTCSIISGARQSMPEPVIGRAFARPVGSKKLERPMFPGFVTALPAAVAVDDPATFS
jgi:hypothetical protein